VQQRETQSPVGSDYSVKLIRWVPPVKERLSEVEFDLILYILKQKLSEHTVKCFTDGIQEFYEISYRSVPFAYAFLTDSRSLLFRIDENGGGVCNIECDSERDRACLEERLIPNRVKEMQSHNN
jgi:hypothetical protein